MDRKFKVTDTLQDAYIYYIKHYKKVNKKLYLNIAYEITKNISDMIIRESLEYKLPENYYRFITF